jgi:hypothetical protein
MAAAIAGSAAREKTGSAGKKMVGRNGERASLTFAHQDYH